MANNKELNKHEKILYFGVGMLYGKGKYQKNQKKSAKQIMDIKTGDAKMAHFFVKWLYKAMLVPKENIYARVFIAPHQSNSREMCESFWREAVGINHTNFLKTALDKSKATGQKSHSKCPFGQIRIFIKNKSGFSVSIYNKHIHDLLNGIISFERMQ